MTASLVDEPFWWSVLAGYPTNYWVDPLESATVTGPDRVGLHYRSGAQLSGRMTCPTSGVMRLQVLSQHQQPYPMPDIADAGKALSLSHDEGSVQISGVGVEGRLGAGGLVTHTLSRPGAASMEIAEKEALPIADMAANTGRLMRGDVQVGWVEAVSLAPGAAVYGSGESFQGLDLRGRRRTLVNRETHTATGRDLAYLNVPLVWSDSGWAMLANTGGMVGLDVGASQRETAAVVIDGPALDLLIFGGTPAHILATHWDLTGLPGEVPDWAFGVWLSRATYISEAEVGAVLDDLAAADGLPDVVHVDAWLDGNVFRTFTCEWRGDRVRFPLGWTARLRERGVRSSVWLNPFVLAGSDVGERLRESGLLLTWPDGSPATTADRANRWIVDFTHPLARRWWDEAVSELFAVEAPDAVKLDFAEEIPSAARCHDGRTGAQVRNLYAHLYQSQTLSAINALRDTGHLTGPVPMFCRSGTHGSQRNPCHWVGDTPATWDGLVSALYAVQSLSLSGFGLVAHDAGGFISPGTGEIPTQRLDGQDVPFFADVDPELYARWVQWGALTPMMRLHGLGYREPTSYPEPYRSAALGAFALRRRLVPHLAAAYPAGLRSGFPLLRPMALAFPHDPVAKTAELQYLLGPDILVAPVVTPGGRRTLYVPPGEWVNLFDDHRVHGPGWVDHQFDVDSFPGYARAESPLITG